MCMCLYIILTEDIFSLLLERRERKGKGREEERGGREREKEASMRERGTNVREKH